MVNREQVYDIPLEGKGLVRKNRGGPFAPGEFRIMRNCELMPDLSIRNRRSIRAADNSSDPVDADMLNINTGFIGHYYSGSITGGKYSHKIYGQHGSSGFEQDLWDPTFMNSLNNTIDAPDAIPPDYVGTNETKITNTATDWRQIVGFFLYNKEVYWIIQSYIQARSTDGQPAAYFHLMRCNEPYDKSLTTVAYSDLTISLIAEEELKTLPASTIPGDVRLSPGTFPEFKGFFIFKDRLWIFTQKTIYFSKALYPYLWSTADGGGFMNFNEHNINDVVGVKDSLYIVCDNRIYIATYSVDPNSVSDLSIRLITDNFGGDSCVVYGNTVYGARDDSLFSMSDQTITKIRDLDFFYDSNPDAPVLYKWKLVSFGNYIVAMARKTSVTTQSSYPGTNSQFPVDNPSLWKDIPKYFDMTMTQPPTSDKSLNFNNSTFFINMLNGAVHSFDSYAEGYLQDLYFNPTDHGEQNLSLLYVNGPYTHPTLGGNFSGHWYYDMKLTQDDVVEVSSYDSKYSSVTDTKISVGFVTDLELLLDLDGDEFWVKRFRQILLEGSFCQNMSMTFAYDNEVYVPSVSLNTGVAADQVAPIRAPYQVRTSMNQKSRLVILRMYKPYADAIHTPFDTTNLSYLMINKMQLLFSQTARGPQRHYATTGRD